MKKVCIAAVVVALLPSAGFAQPTTRMLSKEAAIVGVLTMVVGGGLMTPVGDTVTLDRDAYCVTTLSVTTGGCSVSHTKRTIGAWTLVGGAALTFIGLQRVTVSPSSTGRGATVTVAWGAGK
jgi:hypothetical protein